MFLRLHTHIHNIFANYLLKVFSVSITTRIRSKTFNFFYLVLSHLNHLLGPDLGITRIRNVFFFALHLLKLYVYVYELKNDGKNLYTIIILDIFVNIISIRLLSFFFVVVLYLWVE